MKFNKEGNKGIVLSKLILIIVFVVIVIGLIIFISKKFANGRVVEEGKVDKTEEYVEVLDDGTKVNTSEALSKTRKYNGLEVTNIQLTTSDGVTVLLADVKNTSSSATELMPITIKILDKNNNVLGTVDGLIAPLEPNAETQLNVGVTSDYSNAYDFEIE